MPAFSAEVPHTLGQDGAVDKLKGFVDGISERYKGQINSVSGDWEDPHTLAFGFNTFGIEVKGRLGIEPEVVRISGELPFSAVMFKGKIVGAIQEGLEKALQA